MAGQVMGTSSDAPVGSHPCRWGSCRPINCKTAAEANDNSSNGGEPQCPRCASHDTNFCYYNTSQPRHFCRACRRYWTLGQAPLPDVPQDAAAAQQAPPGLLRRRRACCHGAGARTARLAVRARCSDAASGGVPPRPRASHAGRRLRRADAQSRRQGRRVAAAAVAFLAAGQRHQHGRVEEGAQRQCSNVAGGVLCSRGAATAHLRDHASKAYHKHCRKQSGAATAHMFVRVCYRNLLFQVCRFGPLSSIAQSLSAACSRS
jgi:hypothetical protein